MKFQPAADPKQASVYPWHTQHFMFTLNVDPDKSYVLYLKDLLAVLKQYILVTSTIDIRLNSVLVYDLGGRMLNVFLHDLISGLVTIQSSDFPGRSTFTKVGLSWSKSQSTLSVRSGEKPIISLAVGDTYGTNTTASKAVLFKFNCSWRNVPTLANVTALCKPIPGIATALDNATYTKLMDTA